MRLILARHITSFLLLQHFAQVTPISVFDIFVLSTYNLVAFTLQHRKDMEPSMQEESISTLCRFSFPLGGVSHHQSTMCHKHRSVLPAFWLSAGLPCVHISVDAVGQLLLQEAAHQVVGALSSPVFPHTQCVGPEHGWVLWAFREVHC